MKNRLIHLAFLLAALAFALAIGLPLLHAQIEFPAAQTAAVTIETTDTLGSLITTKIATTASSSVNLSQGTVTLSGASLFNAMAVTGGGGSISQSGGILYLNITGGGGGGGGGGDSISLTLNNGLTGNVSGASTSSTLTLGLGNITPNSDVATVSMGAPIGNFPKLGNLTGNGLVTTSSGNGTLGITALSSLLQAANNLSDLGSAATARTNLGLGSAATASSATFLQAANNLNDLGSLGAARSNLNIQYPSGSHFLFSATTSGAISVTSSFATAPYAALTDPYGYFGNANLGATGSYSTAYVCPVSGPVLFGSQINNSGGASTGSRIIEALFEEGSLVAVTWDWQLGTGGVDTHMASCTIWNATAGKRYQMETLSGTGSFSVYTGSVFYAQQASPLSARFTAKKVFTTLAAAYTSSCAFTFTGTFSGQTGFYPDTGGVSYPIMDIRDTAAAIRYAPANFTATEIANIIAMYGQGQVVSIAGSAGAGIPECINPNSTFGVVGDHAPDSTHIPDLDGVYDWVDMMYSHFLKTGSATQYATYATSVSAALASNTIDHHLVYINPSAEGPPGWGFQDSEDIRGHDLYTSVERFRAYKQIAAMVAANSGDPSSWNNELPLITSNLDTYLFNSGSGLFLTCDTTTQSNNVPNIPGSCYAVYLGAASTTSSAAIVAACHNGYTGNAGDLAGNGFVYGGQVRHMPRGTYFTTFRSSGTPDQYQDGGYWMFFAPWYAYCLAKNDVTEAEEFLNEAANFSLAKPSVGATESYGPQANSYLGANQYLDSACAPLGYYNGIQF